MANEGAGASTGATGAAVVLVTAAVGMLAAGARSLKVTRKLVTKGGSEKVALFSLNHMRGIVTIALQHCAIVLQS